ETENIFLGKPHLAPPFALQNTSFVLWVFDEKKLAREIFEMASTLAFSFGIRRDSKGIISEIVIFLEETSVRLGCIFGFATQLPLSKTTYNTSFGHTFIPVIGPDGSGKTSLICAIAKDGAFVSQPFRFKGLYRKSFAYQMMAFVKKITYKNLDKNELDNQYNRFCYITACLRFPFLKTQHLSSKGTLLVDRYFYDCLIKDVRHPTKRAYLDKFWKGMVRWMPKPSLLVHLDAPYALIRARRDEVSEENIHVYRESVFALYLQNPCSSYLYLNTCQDVPTLRSFFHRFVDGI
ncbi:MAG: hypothetical protein IBX45_13320, partial [Campylobacterales bacterium]|nr:hypothetical protein [Campylobacterales bacterium]